MSLGSNISAQRRKIGMTQAQLAEAMEVTFQAVSSWERDEYLPDTEHLIRLAQVLHVSASRLAGEYELPQWQLNNRIFDETHMYTFVKAAAAAKGYAQVSRVLPLVKKWHAGQTRKGEGQVPYIVHPLTMACHALAMGVDSDDVLAALLLHDVVEDCGVQPESLPVSADVRDAVALVSYPKGQDKAEVKPAYYEGIMQHPIACLVKCLDRCNNLSTMALGFTREKMADYIMDTEQYVFLLLRQLKDVYPQWNHAAWLLRYQMGSLMETLKRVL